MRTALVTGAARGIGRATVERLLAEGWRVGAFDLDAQGVESLAGPGCLTGALDVTEPSSVRTALASFGDWSGGQLHALINNAGVMHVGPFESVDPAQHRQVIAVNLQGVVDVAHASFELLRDTPGSRLINVSSGSASYGTAELASYSATKHGVRGFTEALDVEWRRHDIRVFDVMPMFVQTELLTDTNPLTSQGWLGVTLTAEDVAAAIVRAANGRQWRVHRPLGWQAWLAYHGAAALPTAITRRAMALISGMRR